jgi:hypothetical protein
MPGESKKPFLVAFDYLKAGYWGVMLARSPAEIHAKWPELTIVEDRPPWMTEDDYQNYLARAYDIDGAPHGILNMILNSRRSQ